MAHQAGLGNHLAQEYAAAFQLPVWINRCGVLAGAGQFGTAEQGIFRIGSMRICAPASALFGFCGHGYQVRDALHPRDLAGLVIRQMRARRSVGKESIRLAAGRRIRCPWRSLPLVRPALWPASGSNGPSPSGHYDVPWMVMDNRPAQADFDWRPVIVPPKYSAKKSPSTPEKS